MECAGLIRFLSERGTMGKRLYVGNLAYATTEADLSTLFGEIGPVESVALITDRDSGRSKGFAFVEMQTDDAARQAITAINGREVSGRSLVVNEAQPRERRPDFSPSRSGGFEDFGRGDSKGGESRGRKRESRGGRDFDRRR